MKKELVKDEADNLNFQTNFEILALGLEPKVELPW